MESVDEERGKEGGKRSANKIGKRKCTHKQSKQLRWAPVKGKCKFN